MSEGSHLRRALEQPLFKRIKMGKTQENGTMTDQDMLGPCEPGTAINLDGIVWNESKGGLLSLNITWRGKSFMGTLLDCSTSEHASEWAAPWTADTEAPNLKPKCYYNKHYMKKKMKMKKKKKRKHMAESDTKIVMEPSEIDNKKEAAEPKYVSTFPTKLIKCKRENCNKKFTSESALQYHVSFVHAKIPTQDDKNTIVTKTKTNFQKDTAAESYSYFDPQFEQVNDSIDCKDQSVQNKSQFVNEDKTFIMQSQPRKKVEVNKIKPKSFASTLNMRPIVPVSSNGGSSLIPIQPKPMILPGNSVSLCLDDLKKVLKKSPSRAEFTCVKALKECHLVKENTKCKSIVHIAEEEPPVLDLRKIEKDSPENRKQFQNNSGGLPYPNSIGTASFPHGKDCDDTFKSQIKPELDLEYQYIMNNTTKDSLSFKTPTLQPESPKQPIPRISIKKEFNTGFSKMPSDNTDQPEILKHTKGGANVHIPQTSIMPSILPSNLAFLPQSYFTSQSGILSPLFNTNPLMLPGLMNIPPTSSSFGSSLESLAKAAKEQTRHFSTLNQACDPAALIQAPIPAAHESDPTEVALLRHEHMHTHLHYVTSPTHSNN